VPRWYDALADVRELAAGPLPQWPPVPAGRAAEAPTEAEAPLPVMLSAPDLARWFKLSKVRVESALRRFREDHPDCCEEVQTRRRNEPRYLYRTDDVRPVLERLSREG
jgi:hypothetical protein